MVTDFSTDKLCRWYLIHSLLYYQYQHNVISDETFDGICRELLERFDDISDYFRQWIDKESLKGGTGFSLDFWRLPSLVITTAHILKTGVDFSGNKIDLNEWLV